MPCPANAHSEAEMIRRTFLKALCASPLGFLIPKRRKGPELTVCDGAITLDQGSHRIEFYAGDPLSEFADQYSRNLSKLLDEIVIKSRNI